MAADKYLACTLVGESRGEPIEGIIGVANVIKNRAVAAKNSYKNICLASKQFSCWNQEDPNFALISKVLNDLENGNPIIDPFLIQCIAVARCICEDEFRDNVHGAKNYVTLQRYQLALARQGKDDEWIVKMKPVVTLGNHIFLIEK